MEAIANCGSNVPLASQQETIDALLEPLEVVLALGGAIPAPVGAYGFVLIEYTDEHFTDDPVKSFESFTVHGIFQSKESAENAMATILLDRWKNKSIGPWMPRPSFSANALRSEAMLSAKKEKYRKTHSAKEFLTWCRENGVIDYAIEKVRVIPGANFKGE